MNKIVFKDYNNIKQAIDFLYMDERLIVVNKPAHLPVIPDRFGTYNYNLKDIIKKYLQKNDSVNELFVVHRIDVDTTGLVMLARDEEYHKVLNDLFESRRIEKKYLAIITSHLPDSQGIIDKPILKTARRMIVNEKGKPSKTEYKVLEEFENFSLVELKPFTGRTHQLRVHLKSMDCPLAVDPLYGKHDAFYLRQIKSQYQQKENKEARPLCARLTLHACQLNFSTPDNETMHFEAALPKDFMAVLKSLRKYNNGHSKSVAESGHYENKEY
jgi:RluA family pseudouridine synthase